MQENSIYCGDNLEILSQFPDKSVDLIYADPPFFSNRHYEIIWDDGAEIRAFEDRWKGGIAHYVRWMKLRLVQCHRVLKDTGSMYLHCDWHANAHLRILMDEIFGGENFQNEIIWCYSGPTNVKNYYPRKHDNIYFYSKTNNHIFNTPRIPYRGKLRVGGKTSWSGSEKDVTEYLARGKACEDWWIEFPALQRNEKERLGYPTQKPEALLRRIIEASSNKGDIILGPFLGSGTTAYCAKKLNRKCIGIEIEEKYCEIAANRCSQEVMELNI